MEVLNFNPFFFEFLIPFGRLNYGKAEKGTDLMSEFRCFEAQTWRIDGAGVRRDGSSKATVVSSRQPRFEMCCSSFWGVLQALTDTGFQKMPINCPHRCCLWAQGLLQGDVLW